MRKIIKILLIILLILVAVLAFYFYQTGQLKFTNPIDKSAAETPGYIPPKNDSLKFPLNISSGEQIQEKITSGEIPPNFNTADCGFYFEKYGICAGQCPSGTCVSEGRSCYCKR